MHHGPGRLDRRKIRIATRGAQERCSGEFNIGAIPVTGEGG